MSALLKGPAAAFATRPLTTRSATMLQIVSAEAVPSPELSELSELRIQCATLADALAAARGETDVAVAAALEKGRSEGRAEVVADEERKAQLIVDACTKAEATWEARLTGLDGLAAQLAGLAVGKIFGRWEETSELVIRAARARLDTLRREAVLALHVSAEDFSGEDALAAAAERLGRPAGQLVVDPHLGTGECRIALTLGAIDIGPREQIAAVASLLEALAEGRSA